MHVDVTIMPARLDGDSRKERFGHDEREKKCLEGVLSRETKPDDEHDGMDAGGWYRDVSHALDRSLGRVGR
jgi:hypothetical protein